MNAFSLTYTARTPDEFKDLILWMKDNDLLNTRAASVRQPSSGGNGEDEGTTKGKGPKELEYLSLSKESRMRTTREEDSRIKGGTATREDIASERIKVWMEANPDAANAEVY